MGRRKSHREKDLAAQFLDQHGVEPEVPLGAAATRAGAPESIRPGSAPRRGRRADSRSSVLRTAPTSADRSAPRRAMTIPPTAAGSTNHWP